MSHHILEKVPLILDRKLSDSHGRQSTDTSETPPHDASTSTSPVRMETSSDSEQSTQTRPVQSNDRAERQSQPLVELETAAATTLQLRPSALVASQDRRATAESDEEDEPNAKQNHGFQSPKPEDGDFYDCHNSTIAASSASRGSPSEPSSVPLSDNGRPPVQTSLAFPAEASIPVFLSHHNSSTAASPTCSLPADLEIHTLPTESYVPLGGRSAVSSTSNSGLWSGATPSTLTQLPRPPAKSPHHEPPVSHSPESHTPAHEDDSKDGESYTRPPGSSHEWPHYYTPVVEGEDVIKCYGPVDAVSGDATGFGYFPCLPPSQSSGWLKEKLDRQKKNASSSSIHANVKNNDDVQKCPAAVRGVGEEAEFPPSSNPSFTEDKLSNNQPSDETALKQGPGLTRQDLQAKYEDAITEIQKNKPKAARHMLINPRFDVRTRIKHVQQADSLLTIMLRNGFHPTKSWLEEWESNMRRAREGIGLPLLAFATKDYGRFFNLSASRHETKNAVPGSQRMPNVLPNLEEAIRHEQRGSNPRNQPDSRDIESQMKGDLAEATRQGAVDGCAVGMRLMSIVGSRPNSTWRKQYHILTNNALVGGDVEPLIELVRQEAEAVCARNASARADKARATKDDLANLKETSSNSDADSSNSDDEEDINAVKLHRIQSSHEYGIWLCHNFPKLPSERIIWIANPWISNDGPRLQPPNNPKHATTRPFLLTLGQLFVGHETTVRMCMMVLAVKITLPEKPQAETIYAEVALQDTGYRERLRDPVRVQGFGVRGEIIDLDQEAIISQLDSVIDDYSRRKGKGPMRDGAQQAAGPHDQASSSASGVILHRHDSDASPSKMRSSDLHLTTAETRALHPNVFSDKGMTVVPLEEFPIIPEDPYNFVHYQLQIGQRPSTIFVNCERCLKILASFENVVEGPTVARRAEGEGGDTYIVTALSSLDNIIDSVDKVKRVWVHVGTEKYFMRANEAGVPRTHDCVSVEETVTAEMMGDQAEHSRAANGYHRLGDLPAHNHPMRQPRPPLAEPAQQPEQSSIRMPSSMQFIPIHPSFPTAELSGNPPCTVIAVNELSEFIHGVCQGVVGYRAIFRGASELGETVRLNIRNPVGAFVGTLTRIRYFELVVMDGQVYSFTAQDQDADAADVHRQAAPITADMNAHPPCLITAVCERSRTIHGVYQGVTGYRCVFRPAGEAGDTVSLDIRDPFGAFLGKLTRVRHYEVAIMNGEIAGFTAQDEINEAATTQNHEGEKSHEMSLRGGATPSDEWITPVDGVLEDNSDSDCDSEPELPDCHDEESSGGERAVMRTAASQWVPTRLPSLASKHEQPPASASPSTSQPHGGSTTNPMFRAIEPSHAEPISDHPNANSVGADRIPSFLQPTPSNGPATDNGEPVFSEEYKEWLRSMYTKPSNQRCAVINTAPAPGFQDFWKDKEAGRPATTAGGDIWRPETEEQYGAEMEDGEYKPLHSDSRGEGQAGLGHSGHDTRHTGDVPIVLADGQAQSEGRRLHLSERYAAQLDARQRAAQPTIPNPAVVRILKRFLHEQAVRKAREAFNAAVRGDYGTKLH